ncbi:MAG TPA: helix-turn-helix domain-containing protein, partial [Nitrososphaeraceae archaeon]|nr:helix-turn-helix domain-containing protein [Nitrososphaeraceae archaeon]
MEAIPKYLELSIIRAWLKGETRDEIAQELGKSQGTISNVIAKFRNELGNYVVDALRELGKELRRLEITPNNCAIGFRIFTILEKLKIPEENLKEFLTTLF